MKSKVPPPPAKQLPKLASDIFTVIILLLALHGGDLLHRAPSTLTSLTAT